MYEKRVCVLKQVRKGFTADGGTLSGAVYLERLGEGLTVTPRLLGVAPVKEGFYALVLKIEKKFFVFELKGAETLHADGAPSLSEGVSALVAFVRGSVKPVAFGCAGNAENDFRPLLAAISGEPAPGESKQENKPKERPGEGKKKSPPLPLSPVQTPSPPSPNVPLAPTVPLPGPFREGDYDDEAIAERNYFGDEDGVAPSADRGGGGEKADGQKADGDDGAVHPFLRPQAPTYYNEVRKKLEEAFRKYPRDRTLEDILSPSEWVRTDGALLGIVYREGIPEYLCVAVEAKGEPPEEMRGKCTFVPSSHFSDGEGYFVVFQSASSGEYVTVKNV